MESGAITLTASPASPKQLAYLSYMGITLRGSITEAEAAKAISRLESISDYEQWRQLVEKKNEWHTDRFLLHPQLFAAEFEVYYHSELPDILANHVRSQAPEAARHLTPPNIRATMDSLSAQNPSWWRSPRRQRLFLAELVEKVPSLNQTSGSGVLTHLREGLHHLVTGIATYMRSLWSKGAGGAT